MLKALLNFSELINLSWIFKLPGNWPKVWKVSGKSILLTSRVGLQQCLVYWYRPLFMVTLWN